MGYSTAQRIVNILTSGYEHRKRMLAKMWEGIRDMDASETGEESEDAEDEDEDDMAYRIFFFGVAEPPRS